MARTIRQWWSYDDHWNSILHRDGRDAKRRHSYLTRGATKHRALRARAARQQVRALLRTESFAHVLLTRRRAALSY
ncbi:MAG: hypothetical protein WC683_00855 [bacterium]